MRVLVIGKPRSGKTTLTKELEKSLNLVRVSVDNWLANLFKKIKDREENQASILAKRLDRLWAKKQKEKEKRIKKLRIDHVKGT